MRSFNFGTYMNAGSIRNNLSVNNNATHSQYSSKKSANSKKKYAKDDSTVINKRDAREELRKKLHLDKR